MKDREDKWSLLVGDCRESLATMPDNSLDSCVCDPPYELGFMGRKWDASGIAYDVAMWRDVLRVLKPGAHLLAFGGTRTYHRMACAIEDAGFEIRDSIMWLHAVGFPKSLNISAALDVQRCKCDGNERDLRDVSLGVQDAENAREDSKVLLAPVLGKNTRRTPAQDRPSGSRRVDSGNAGECQREDDGAAEPGMEGRHDVLPETRELQADQVRSVSAGPAFDGAQGRVCDGAPSHHGPVGGATVDAHGGGAPREPRPAAQRAEQPGIVAGQPEPQTGGAWPACGRCNKPLIPDGIGSALKPAVEPVVVARKPLAGTLAANVLAHGTGGLSIDGCRIPSSPGDEPLQWETPRGGIWRTDAQAQAQAQAQALGRWPANVIHDGSPEVLEAFARYGDRPSGASVGDGGRIFGAGGGPTHDGYPGDDGSAARFFFCAKASRAEREIGCEGLAARTREDVTGREADSAGQNHARSGMRRTGAIRNIHPTVKPLALLRYLCRLVTPPGGTVLDPFSGSGTCGMAALLEGFRYVGMELLEEHARIGQARIGHVDGYGWQEDEEPEQAPRRKQLALFGEVAP